MVGVLDMQRPNACTSAVEATNPGADNQDVVFKVGPGVDELDVPTPQNPPLF